MDPIEWQTPDQETVLKIREGILANQYAENRKDEGLPAVEWIAPEDVDRLGLS